MLDRRLRVLRTLAQQGTVTGAADVLGYTPSAVSHQIKTLGRELGVPLLEPHGRGVLLTPAARLLLERTQEMHAEWERIRTELAQLSHVHGFELRLCGFSTAAAALLPAAVARVQAVFPACRVIIIEADPEECFELLVADRADVAVVVATDPLPPRSDTRFEQDDLLRDPLDLLVPANHRLAGHGPVGRNPAPQIGLQEAARERWILDRPGSAHHRLVRAACSAAGFSPEIAHVAREWDTGAALVSAGLGVALIPRLARLPAGYDVVRVPLRGEPTPARQVLTGVLAGSREHPVIATALDSLAEAARAVRAAGVE